MHPLNESLFKTFGLPDTMLHALEKLGVSSPTPIQEQAIPIALEGHDVLGTAQTGTGKTLAYLIPLCMRLLAKSDQHALILTPTREIAIQVFQVVEKLLGKSKNFYTALLIGGDPMPKQFQQLRRKPRLIIGTPGRVNDHLDRNSLSLKQTRFLVLDETDRMLDMGFSEQLDTIFEVMHHERQTLMFSATMPPHITKIAQSHLKHPKHIAIGQVSRPCVNIQQDVIHTTKNEKFDHLLKELDKREGSVIVFVKTKMGCEELKDKLRFENHSAEAIHGDLHQRKRERVIQGFRANKNRIVVATDVAARGLDVPHIRHVINYDLPQCPEDYIHRIGRTGRAGSDGFSLSLLSSEDRKKWFAIQRLINPDEKVHFPKDSTSKPFEKRSFKKRSFDQPRMGKNEKRFSNKKRAFNG